MAGDMRLVGAFTAKAADDKNYEIMIYQKYTDIPEVVPDARPVPGVQELRTQDGSAVRRKGPGVYSILFPRGEVEVRSDDPTAP